MNAFDKIKRSWWVIFPFTQIFSGVGFIYMGLKSSNRNWILEGVTYELPLFLFILASAIYPSRIMILYYVGIILLAAVIALIRSIMVAVRLFDVYEMEDSRRVNATVVSTPDGSRHSGVVNKVKEKSNFEECCCCVLLIFIIFAVISIL